MAASGETREREGALRLSRLLQAALDDVEAVVERLEVETEAQERPLLLISAAGLASRSLADRIGALTPATDDKNGNGSR